MTLNNKLYSIETPKNLLNNIENSITNQYSPINKQIIISVSKILKKNLKTEQKVKNSNIIQNKIQEDLIVFKNKLKLYKKTLLLAPPTLIYNKYLKLYKRSVLRQMGRFKWLRHFYLSIKIVNRATFLQNAGLLAKFCAWQIKKDKRHRYFIFFITEVVRRFFKYRPQIYGLRLLFKGRIQGSTRSKKVLKKFGKTPLQSLYIKIDYSIQEALTRYGICSIKVWFCYI